LKESLSLSDDRKKAFWVADFESLRLGTVPIARGGTFDINPEAPVRTGPDGRPVFGMLGTEAFAAMDFELDLSRRKINLFSQDHCDGEVVYWAHDWGSAPLHIGHYGTIYFPLELEGRKIEATFQPGSAASVLSVYVTKRVYGFDKGSPGVQVVASDDGKTAAHFRAMQMTARAMTFHNTPVRLIDAPPKSGRGSCKLRFGGPESGAIGYSVCGNVYPMALGGNVLEKMRIYFATKEKMVYFTLADGSVGEKDATAPATP